MYHHYVVTWFIFPSIYIYFLVLPDPNENYDYEKYVESVITKCKLHILNIFLIHPWIVILITIAE